MTRLSEAERIARIRLIRSDTIGPITFYRLLQRFGGSAMKALEQLPTLMQRRNTKKTPHITTVQDVADELNLLEAKNGRMIVFGDTDYPEWLSTIEDAPPVLSIIGNGDLLSKSCVGIVGARNASANAKRFTMTLSDTLGQKEQVIVSGLARGIDTMAHQASINTGTVAVLAGGVDQIYPTENTDLYHEIAKQGCLVSEVPFGTKPTAHHFPRRNRIVSGLSKGVIVVEASMKSGSLITARLAGEQGRDVFAVPGFPGDPRATGPNYLIQNGAILIQNADDVLDELRSMDERKIQPQQASFEGIMEDDVPFIGLSSTDQNSDQSTHEVILQNLSNVPLLVDELAHSCDMSIAQLQTGLFDLELSGDIERHPGNRVSKVA